MLYNIPTLAEKVECESVLELLTVIGHPRYSVPLSPSLVTGSAHALDRIQCKFGPIRLVGCDINESWLLRHFLQVVHTSRDNSCELHT